ncbi:hypothetical protein Poli38472_006986 [Pythium oligandrum]|uniref:FAD-binding FR-type domain-containing protein n=1 Tax=Pythium oligandrum TaxID=41045 RepID=A0A8K1C9G5_PYTOL|nr:hypothetical protein Poli38472_006986 [Pythium oligandrum]|eukprot:TMW58841.1 hypothetical protein Poli38472_006986 [Pythium oligandrum]
MAPLQSPVRSDYVSVKTPDRQRQHESKSGVSSWSERYAWVGQIAQFLIIASMCVFVAGNLIYFNDCYENTIKGKIGVWWGVQKASATTGGRGGGGKGQTKGHSEMVRPTFFTLFTVLPTLVSLFLIEFLRHYNVRRVTSTYVLKFAMLLRRKPSLFGRVSYWSFGEWIFMAFLVVGNILVFVWFYVRRYNRIKSAVKGKPIEFNTYLEMIALTFGFNCVYCMAFLFLPATRNSAWMEFFNISYANGIKYHRWLGVVTVVTAFLHCLGYYWSWIRQKTWREEALPCFDCPLSDRKGRAVWINVFGELALLLFLIIGFTSVPYIRRKFYNLFYYAHQLFILAIVFSVLHWGPIVWWIFPTFLVYCYRRVISTSHAFSPVQVKELTALDNDIVKITLHRSTQTDGHFHVGQFLYINVPALSKLQWHAFTIASSPHANPTTLTLYIKSLGDWTRDLVTYANDCKQQDVLPTVYVDGYYGSSLGMYEEYSTLCLIGGGIGATPMFAILEDLVSKLSSGRGSSLRQRVVFVFSFRELSLLEELHPLLLRVKELDPHEQHFKLHFYLTRPVGDDVLSKSLDHERLQGFQQHIQPTQYSAMVTCKVPRAFYQPLRSRTSTVVVSLVVFVVAWILLVYLEYGNGKISRGSYPQLWPLQRFVELAVLMLAGAVVYLFVFAERAKKNQATALQTESKEVDLNVMEPAMTPRVPVTDLHTYQDLLSHYAVIQGERPNVRDLMAQVYDFHCSNAVVQSTNSVIGVFVSGPEAMKRDAGYAAAAIGVRHFDIHEEEFEL